MNTTVEYCKHRSYLALIHDSYKQVMRQAEVLVADPGYTTVHNIRRTTLVCVYSPRNTHSGSFVSALVHFT